MPIAVNVLSSLIVGAAYGVVVAVCGGPAWAAVGVAELAYLVTVKGGSKGAGQR